MRTVLVGYAKRSVDFLIRKMLARPRIRAYLQALWAKYRKEMTGAVADAGDLAELLPLNLQRSTSGTGGSRLNLLVPAVSVQHVFGGIATALQLFDALRIHFDSCRIIVTDETCAKPDPAAYFGHWPIVALDAPSPDVDHLVVAGSRWGHLLSVHENDSFMATAWWTAYHGISLLKQMDALYSPNRNRRLLYLIQDYEPGFYPWSARHVLARSTYAHGGQTVALVNSQQLADYLHLQGHHFVHQAVFDPRLNPELAALRDGFDGVEKSKTLLVYARPGVERNAFPLVIATLRSWVDAYPEANQWKVLGLGENFVPIDLGHGCKIESLGKLTLSEYAALLAGASVGLSLMVSPHPSYPPLEMAAYGLNVLTNSFSTKDLSRFSEQIASVSELSVDNLASALKQLTIQFDQLPQQKRYFSPYGVCLPPAYLDKTLLSEADIRSLVGAFKGG